MIRTSIELVSIIIPTYSRNDTLVRAISSALNQTYTNIEIIVVDDNPAESEWRQKTEKIMSHYSDEPRVRYIKNKKNMGGAGARNEGIKVAKGEYIAFLDDDDEYLPKNIELKIGAFLDSDNEKLALVYGYSEYVDAEKVVYESRLNYNGCCLYEAMKENCIAATSQWMVRKKALEAVGGFSIVPSKQDSQVILKLLVEGFELKCVPVVLSRYYMDYNQFVHISNNGRKPLEGELLYRAACRKQYDQLNKQQINTIEYKFAVVLYEKYKQLADRENMHKEKKHMYRLNPVKASYYSARQFLRAIKHR